MVTEYEKIAIKSLVDFGYFSSPEEFISFAVKQLLKEYIQLPKIEVGKTLLEQNQSTLLPSKEMDLQLLIKDKRTREQVKILWEHGIKKVSKMRELIGAKYDSVIYHHLTSLGYITPKKEKKDEIESTPIKIKRMIKEGKTAEEIAKDLNLPIQSVKFYFKQTQKPTSNAESLQLMAKANLSH